MVHKINQYFSQCTDILVVSGTTGSGSGNYIYYWKSKELSDKRINFIKTPDYGTTPKLNYFGTKTRAEFNGSCLKQDKITYTHEKIVNIYMVYELTGSDSGENDPTVKTSLFDAVTLLISIITNILDMELDLIEDHFLHFQVVDLLKMQ